MCVSTGELSCGVRGFSFVCQWLPAPRVRDSAVPGLRLVVFSVRHFMRLVLVPACVMSGRSVLDF